MEWNRREKKIEKGDVDAVDVNSVMADWEKERNVKLGPSYRNHLMAGRRTGFSCNLRLRKERKDPIVWQRWGKKAPSYLHID